MRLFSKPDKILLIKRPFRQMLVLPYIWVILFLLLPFFVILKISFSVPEFKSPPYSDLWRFSDGVFELLANFDNYIFFFSESLYLHSVLGSVKIALISTIIALLVSFPIALAILQISAKYRNLLLFLIAMPFWTSFLIRVYAWKVLLQNHGLVNNFLIWSGITSSPIQFLYTDFAVYLGIVYSYLPFMVLPIYAVLERLDKDLIDAARDLGCSSLRILFYIIIPLSLPGIIAGCALVFIPALGEFVIPELLGDADNILLGRLLWQEFFNIRNWPMGASIVVIMVATVILVAMAVVFLLRYNSFRRGVSF